MLVLIVEDDPAIVRFLERGLAAHGHSTMAAGDGEEGVRLAAEESVEMVLLDVMLPRLDGQQVLQRIRLRRPDLPVLMLTARDEVHHKVDALDSGADDYLTKPFDLEELLARIRALTRRADQPWSSRLAFGDLNVDLRSRRVRRGEKQIDLSSREFALLEYFMRHPGQVLSRQQILSAVWDYAFDPGSNVVDVYVRYLRSKLDRRGEPSVIQTVRGAGYRFEPPADAQAP
jgi:DNA-binding response OmpR family regulator